MCLSIVNCSKVWHCVCLMSLYQVNCGELWCVWFPNIKCPAGRWTISKGGWYTASPVAPSYNMVDCPLYTGPYTARCTLVHWLVHCPWYTALVYSGTLWYTVPGTLAGTLVVTLPLAVKAVQRYCRHWNQKATNLTSVQGLSTYSSGWMNYQWCKQSSIHSHALYNAVG